MGMTGAKPTRQQRGWTDYIQRTDMKPNMTTTTQYDDNWATGRIYTPSTPAHDRFRERTVPPTSQRSARPI